jgi:hypothetical protein
VGFLILFSVDFPGRRIARIAAIGAGLSSIAYAWLASFEYRDIAVVTQARTYRAIATTCNYPSWWFARSTNAVFGPVVCQVQLSPSNDQGSSVLLAAGREGMINRLVLERLGPGKIRLRLVANLLVLAETPILHHDGPTLHVTCAAPWLYPPPEHPYWSSLTDQEERKVRQSLFGIGADTAWTAVTANYAFDSTSLDPFVRTAPSDPAQAGAWVVRWRRLNLADPANPPPPSSPPPAAPGAGPKS